MKIILKKIIPRNIYDIYQNLISTENIIEFINNDTILKEHFICPNILTLINFLKEKFQLEKCLDDTVINIFQRGIFKELDEFEVIILNNK